MTLRTRGSAGGAHAGPVVGAECAPVRRLDRQGPAQAAIADATPILPVGADAPDVARAAPQALAGDVYINGRFLTQRGSGVQRFARQLVLALDAELGQGPQRRWFLLVPPGAARLPNLQRIEVRVVGSARWLQRSGHLWDQWLRFCCRPEDILLNLANSGPVLRTRSIAVLHDAAVFRTPRNFTPAYRLFHQLLGRLIALRSRIGTVSEFSRAELAAILGVAGERIFVVPNGCDHLRAVAADAAVLPRLGLERGRYFLAVGSPVANKNLRMAIEAFLRLDDPALRLVLVGSVDTAVFGADLKQAPPGVVLAGFLPDEQLAALLRGATALVFPSLYEGFGIPPLEAMVHACPVIASRIPPVVEVCADAVLYFDPTDMGSLLLAMRRALGEPELLASLIRRGEARAARYSWRRSARCLLEAVAQFP